MGSKRGRSIKAGGQKKMTHGGNERTTSATDLKELITSVDDILAFCIFDWIYSGAIC